MPDPVRTALPDVSPQTSAVIELVQPFTMTSPERIAALCHAVEYVGRCGIQGAFVECGVWRGGSCMAAALTLLRLGRADIDLYLFDTFAGMTPPAEIDRLALTGESAAAVLARSDRSTSHNWAYAPLDEVRRNLAGTHYPPDKLHLIAGRVEDTLPARAPAQISVLRLDTDWYESTRHELIHLFPRLAVGGVLIVDDYGHWSGAREAVDEYVAEHKLRILLNRIDYTGRIAIKLDPTP
jgi:O-methyltransferase